MVQVAPVNGPKKATLRFFFDYVSPYSYVAWTQIHRIASAGGVEVGPVPILFAGLLDAHGTRGPAETPAKRRYIVKDLLRLANRLSVPFDLPSTHPFNPLLALRISSLPMSSATRRALVDRLFAATWGGGSGITESDVVKAIVLEAGLPADALLEVSTPEAKARVRHQTDEAIALGVFGVPTMEIGGELFWGCDSLPQLERHLLGESLRDPSIVDRWDNLPSSAQRPLQSSPKRSVRQSPHQPRDEHFEARVRESFSHQGFLPLLGAQITRIEPGIVEIQLSHRNDLLQQNGFFHAGVTATLADAAGGYAAYTLFPSDTDVLTVEYKMNLIAPAKGDGLLGRGTVRKSGRTLTICDLEIFALRGEERELCAVGLQTLICMGG